MYKQKKAKKWYTKYTLPVQTVNCYRLSLRFYLYKITMILEIDYNSGKSTSVGNLRQKETEFLENLILDARVEQILREHLRDVHIAISKTDSLSREAHERDKHKLYLTQIIDIEKPEFGSNNLIIAPVGSGKSSLIEERLLQNEKGRVLMLVSNETLKDHVCPSDSQEKKERAMEGRSKMMFTSKNREKYGMEEYEVHVMTYAEFGNRIYTNNDFVQNVKQIHCDEIHSLPNYQTFKDSTALSHAIKYLFEKHEDKQIFYFTATDEHLIRLNQRQPGVLKHVKTFDYRGHKDIRRYTALSEYRINNIEQIRPHLKARYKSFKYFEYKGLAFSRTIAGQKKIEKIVIEEGFRPLVLWSLSNSSHKMTGEQIAMREEIIRTGIIPEPYNFLIINSAMQEGWDLNDEKIKLAIMNTTNETEHTQALGRIRKDIDVLIYRTPERDKIVDFVEVPVEYLGEPLTSDMKEELCIDLNLTNVNGNITKWPAVKSLLMESGYKVEDSRKTIDGKVVRVSIIHRMY